MMLDIVQVRNGFDLGVAASDIPKAANILSVQIGELEYESEFGVDKKYFLTQSIRFQPASYKAYLVQRLAENQITVSTVLSIVNALYTRLTFFIGDRNQNVKGLIR